MNTCGVLFMQSQTYFGADSLVHSLIMQHLDRSRFEVHVACNRGTRAEASPALTALERVPNLNIRPTSFGPSVNFASTSAIAKQIVLDGPAAVGSLVSLVAYARRNRIRVVHCTEKPRDAFYGYWLSRAIGAVCIVHLHVVVDLKWMSSASQWAMKRADGLIGVSDFVAESARATGHRPDRVFSVLNALDTTSWIADANGVGVRAEYGIPARVPVLGIVSRVFPWKGHSRLLDALAPLKAEGLDFRLLLVGEDDPRATPGHTSHLAELHRQVDRLGLEDQVIFTGFRRDIPEVMAACDIYAMPSFEEPFGMVFLEAMAMERPVIALDSGGVPQIVQDGRTGLLSDPGDQGRLMSNLRVLITDESLRSKMGAAGRARVEADFTPSRLAADVASVYDTVLFSGRRLTDHRHGRKTR